MAHAMASNGVSATTDEVLIFSGESGAVQHGTLWISNRTGSAGVLKIRDAGVTVAAQGAIGAGQTIELEVGLTSLVYIQAASTATVDYMLTRKVA